MSTVTYGDITLEVVKTNDMAMNPVFTEDSVDYLWTHCVLDVDAILNPATTAYVAGSPPVATAGTLPATTVMAIRHQLMQPRLSLIFSTPDMISGDTHILDVPVFPDVVDVNNGPRPISCTVREVLGNRTFLINWRVECWIHECPEGGEENPDALISSRWSQESHINQQHLSTKITRGTAHFRTDILSRTGATADQFRNKLLPVVSPGFHRTNVDIALASAANVIQWTCVDQEVMTDLNETDARQNGSGIVRLEGSYGVSSIATKEGIAGGTTMAQIDIRAWGNKYSSNWRMIQRCFEIVLGKISIGAGAIGFIRQAAIRESLMDRYVEVMIGFQQTAPGNVAIGNLRIDGLRKDDIFQPANGRNPGLPNDKGTRGSAQEQLLVQALTDACMSVPADNIPNPESGDSSSTSTYDGPPPAVHVTPFDELPQLQTPYTPDTQQYPYTSSRMDILYSKDEGLMVAPNANNPNSDNFVPVSVFRLHSPVGYKVIEWTSERVGAIPSIPDPRPVPPGSGSTLGGGGGGGSTQQNLTLMDSDLTAATPQFVDDGGTRVYRISGRYKYVFATKTQGPGDTLDLGSIPWTTDAPGSLQIRESQDYQTGVVDPQASGSA